MATATKAKPKSKTAARPAPRPAARSASRLVPLGDRIVVKQSRQEEVRASGLVIPDTAREKPQMGEVIAVGPGRIDDNGKRVPIDVKTGDRVLYAKYSGQEVPRGVYGSDDDEYMILKENDILAKLA
ncbi:MAG TPA: co-chaperone GroES [Dehalococcoidia bacterium]|nr:co-chaperone GroES [Dehalococcoidia bacterium]